MLKNLLSNTFLQYAANTASNNSPGQILKTHHADNRPGKNNPFIKGIILMVLLVAPLMALPQQAVVSSGGDVKDEQGSFSHTLGQVQHVGESSEEGSFQFGVQAQIGLPNYKYFSTPNNFFIHFLSARRF